MKVFVFGNIDLKNDSLPLRIMPKLQEKFPDIEFEIKDPNVDDPLPTLNDVEGITVLDTVIGIKDVKIFNDLKVFISAPRVSVHDFDALTNLRYLQKLGKIKKIKIIGIPPNMKESEAIKKVSATLR